jgi:hypothetical protein
MFKISNFILLFYVISFHVVLHQQFCIQFLFSPTFVLYIVTPKTIKSCISTSHNHMDLYGPLQGLLYLFLYISKYPSSYLILSCSINLTMNFKFSYRHLQILNYSKTFMSSASYFVHLPYFIRMNKFVAFEYTNMSFPGSLLMK